jgi:hypothetical protein
MDMDWNGAEVDAWLMWQEDLDVGRNRSSRRFSRLCCETRSILQRFFSGIGLVDSRGTRRGTLDNLKHRKIDSECELAVNGLALIL